MNELGRKDVLILAAIALSLASYHLLTSLFSSYGYFIDEFYYLACARRPAAGYVDHPPLSVLLLAANRALFGESLLATRLLPALASGGLVFATGMLAGQLGGRRGAAVLAALAAAVMPVYLVMGSFYSMNAFEPLVLVLVFACVVRIVNGGDPRLWVVAGVLAGLGLETKHTMVVYLSALGVGLASTRGRRLLRNRWVAWAAVACAALVLPNVLWQIQHGFPSLEFYRNAAANKNIPTPPLAVVASQALFAGPYLLPIWLAGLAWAAAGETGRRYRFLVIAYGVLLLAMIAARSSRPDRMAAIYAPLFAAGAVAITSVRGPRVRRALTGVTAALAVGGGALLAPAFTPLLPPSVLGAYLGAIGLSFDIEAGKRNERVPQWLGDRLGWEAEVSEVARVYRALPADERGNAVIVSSNYGDAGAIELLGPRLGLPAVYATHNSFHSWGPPPDSNRTFIGVSVSGNDLRRLFDSVETAAVFVCDECTAPRRRIPIYVVRGPKVSIQKGWPGFRIYTHRRANFFEPTSSPSFVSRPLSPAGDQLNENDIVDSDDFATSARFVGSNTSSPVSLALMLRSVRMYWFGPLATISLPARRSLSLQNSIVVRSPVFASACSYVPT
jgi:MFS family permease